MENRKLINFVAGMTTVILALLIMIVVLEPKDAGVSRAVASKTVALTLAPKEEIQNHGPEQSYFPDVLQNEWYVKYMDYLYETGYLDPERIAAEESSALSSVTYGDISYWIHAASLENEKDFERYLVEQKEKKGFVNAIVFTFRKTVSIFKQMYITLAYLFTGHIKLNQLSGPVGIYSVVGKSREAGGIANVLYLMAFLSINVGVINLLPIPAFDGGHILFIIIEKIKGSPVNPELENKIHAVFLILLMILMVVITFNDIVRLFS